MGYDHYVWRPPELDLERWREWVGDVRQIIRKLPARVPKTCYPLDGPPVTVQAPLIVTGPIGNEGRAAPPTIKVAGLRAFYRPGEDLVQVPFASRFASEEEWYSTLFHELGHATGHEKRLNRLEVTRVSELGPLDLGREELVAELTSSYLCAETGITPATIENQAAYIDNWRRVLEDDRRALVVAAGAAQRAADYILDRQPAGAIAGRAVERERGHEVGAQRDGDRREPGPGEPLEPPTGDLDEPRALAEAGRVPEELR